jgi:hypothetical protein
MQWNFENICSVLEACTPPEITHFQQGNHPGKRWWLKTVVPANADSEPTQIWDRLTSQHPQLIVWVAEAYDWRGDRIPHAHSIWLRNDIDICIVRQPPGFDYTILPFEDSININGHLLLHELQKKQKHFQKQNRADWHKLENIAHCISKWTTHNQAKNRRQKFKVIANESVDRQTTPNQQLDH